MNFLHEVYAFNYFMKFLITLCKSHFFAKKKRGTIHEQKKSRNK